MLFFCLFSEWIIVLILQQAHFSLSSSLVEEGYGGSARLPVPAPGWGKPHPQVDTESAHQRNAGRLRPREEVPAYRSPYMYIYILQFRLLISNCIPS